MKRFFLTEIKNRSRIKFWAIMGMIMLGLFYAVKLLIGVSLMVQLMSLLPNKQTHGVNILLVGTDDVEGSKRSDAISVIHINEDLAKVRALSIPRDTRVTISTVGVSKINHAFAYGGIELLKQTVSEFLSIPIHYHVVVNAQGIVSLIDAIGGVRVSIDSPMKYQDFAGDLDIDFDVGDTHLNGQELFKYLRYRGGAKGDIGRIERQQEVAKLLFNQIFQLKNLAVSPTLIRLFLTSVRTNIGMSKMSHLMRMFLSKNNELSIQFLTVPGSVRLIDGVSFWRPNIVYLDNLISKTFVDYMPVKQPMESSDRSFITNHQIKRVSQQLIMDEASAPLANSPLKLEILNGNGTPGLASKTASYLKSKNTIVTSVANSKSFDYKETLIVDWKGNIEKSLRLAQVLNVKPSNIVVYDRQEKPLDITLVLGHDWTFAYLEGLLE